MAKRMTRKPSTSVSIFDFYGQKELQVSSGQPNKSMDRKKV